MKRIAILTIVLSPNDDSISLLAEEVVPESHDLLPRYQCHKQTIR